MVGGAATAQAVTPAFQMPFPCGEVWRASTYSGHGAIDWNAYPNDDGRTVVASAGGTATPFYDSVGGYQVVIDHGDGWQTLYAHLQSSGRASGSVTQGQAIGLVGGTGAATAPHLHWEQKHNGVKQVPLYANGVALSPGLSADTSAPAYTSQNCGISSASNGSYIAASDTGRVYVMAGGSPMYVSGWGAVGGAHTINAYYTQAQINGMPQYPADGTAVRNYASGGIYIVAGGFGFAVTSLSAIPPNTSWVDIDGSAISNQLRSQPADGTVIRNYGTGGIYVVSGNAAMAVSSLSNIPYTTWTNVDGWAISHQLNQYPTDGSAIVDYSTSTVYIVAGGAATTVVSFANIPPVTSMAYVDHWVLANQLRQYPADGTVVRNASGGIYVMAGGAALAVSSLGNVPYVSWVNIDGWAITNQFLSYPADGTYVRGYTTGKIYAVQNGTTTHLNSWGPGGPQPYTDVDQWAITNQLNAVE